MAKRARGTTSRPGQRAPLRATAPARTSAPLTRPVTLTAEEEARAAELEAQIVAAEKTAAETSRRRTRRGGGEPGTVLNGTIAMRAAEEYGYVARDMRRIALIGGGLSLVLVGLWLVTSLTGIQLG